MSISMRAMSAGNVVAITGGAVTGGDTITGGGGAPTGIGNGPGVAVMTFSNSLRRLRISASTDWVWLAWWG